jgi:hypothetical protein
MSSGLGRPYDRSSSSAPAMLFLLPFTYTDIAPVVDPEGRLDDGILSHVA